MVVLKVILYILLFILVLGIVVCYHEFGHFLFAKKFNVLVNEFAFGMGPKLLSKKKGETVYSIRAFPLGGFCAMSGESLTNCPVKEGSKVKLLLNEAGKVSKIVLVPEVKEEQQPVDILNDANGQPIKVKPKKIKKVEATIYDELPIAVVEKVDLWGKDMSPLFINDLEVERNAMIVFSVKEEIQIAPEERDFSSKKVWQRLLIAFGGPLHNIILALVVFLLMSFIVGVASGTSVIGAVSEGGPAEIAGLKKDDEIIQIGDYAIDSYDDISKAVYETGSRVMTIKVKRGNDILAFEVEAMYGFNNLGVQSVSGTGDTLEIICETEAALGGTSKTFAYQEGGLRNGDIITAIEYNGVKYDVTTWDEVYHLSTNVIDGGEVTIYYTRDGVAGTSTPYEVYSNKLLESQNYDAASKVIGITADTTIKIFPCIWNGLVSFWSAATVVFSTLGLLLTSKEVGVNDLGGFITILNQTASYASGGFTSLLYFIGLLSVNLAILNLLPIPALDGGRIVFLAVEGITRKKVNPKVETIIENVVFWLLMIFIVYVLFQDVLRMVIQLQ